MLMWARRGVGRVRRGRTLELRGLRRVWRVRWGGSLLLRGLRRVWRVRLGTSATGSARPVLHALRVRS